MVVVIDALRVSARPFTEDDTPASRVDPHPRQIEAGQGDRSRRLPAGRSSLP
jgi:hypothetical protein